MIPKRRAFEDRFEERFDVLAAIAYRVAFRILGDRHDAEDVAQEALARAYARWRHVHRYDEPWVARVAGNLALGQARRGPAPVPRHQPGSARDPVSAFVDRTLVVEALEQLPKRQREVVVLRYLADLPEAEVARLLGCTAGTVKQHAHRGLAALRLTLARTDPAGAVPPALLEGGLHV